MYSNIFLQNMFEFDGWDTLHECIFIDEAGFNLTKRGRNIIGRSAIVEVPGQRGGNVTLCAAISHHGVLHHHATLGPYNTQHLLDFLNRLYGSIIQHEAREPGRAEQPQYVVIWDNVSFHRAALVRNWFNDHPRFFYQHTPHSSIP